MTILVCGASGLVGHDLTELLTAKGISWVGTYYSHPVPNSYKLDFFNEEELDSFLDNHQITTIVNCIAERNVDHCEKDWTHTKKINADLPYLLAKQCAKRNIYFLHISTDYVLDGNHSPYVPSAIPNPIQNYGISKLLAELHVQSIHNLKSSIIRVPVLYTHTAKSFSDTAVTLIGKKVLDFTTVHQEDNYCIRRPVFIPDFCIFLAQCIQEQIIGLHHFYNSSNMETKYSMAGKIAKYLGKTIQHIHPNNTPPSSNAGRPYNIELVNSFYKQDSFSTTPIDIGIQLCFEKLYHPKLDFEQKPNDSIFFVLDLDGTILDTDHVHLMCYQKALHTLKHSIHLETTNGIDNYLQSHLGLDAALEVKKQKNKYLHELSDIAFIPGAKEFLTYLHRFQLNFAVVTNTSKANVDFFKSKLPELNYVKQWITREDVQYPKPHPEPYDLAKELYYKGEKYIIGFENTEHGYRSLKNITKCIYIVTKHNSLSYKQLKNEDVYLIPDLSIMNSKETPKIFQE